jgi:tetratricopeptide (TPR) repeat protein
MSPGPGVDIAAADAARPLLGRYVRTQSVARGGGSVVFQGLDLASSERVAIKWMPPTQGPKSAEVDDPERRFEQEAQVLAQLHHPHIVPYLAHGFHDGARVLVMAWVAGPTLAKHLKRNRLTEAGCLSCARTLAGVLAYLATHNVVHRDLKPGNIILRDGDVSTPVVVDFGIAKGAERNRITNADIALGTPRYMAPEQIRSVRFLDGRADVFSLGCVLFECLAGVYAYDGSNAVEVMTRILLTPPKELRKVVPDVSDAFERLLAQLMHREWTHRPMPGAELNAWLDWAGSGNAEPSLPRHERTEARIPPRARLATVPLVEATAAPRLGRERLATVPLADAIANVAGHAANQVGPGGALPDIDGTEHVATLKLLEPCVMKARDYLESGDPAVLKSLGDERSLLDLIFERTEREGDAQAALACAVILALVLRTGGRLHRAVGVLTKALAQAEGHDGVERQRADAQAARGRILTMLGDTELARRDLDDSLAAFLLLALPDEIARVTLDMGVLEQSLGQFEAAHSAYDSVLNLVHGTNSAVEARALMNRGALLHDQGHTASARVHYAEALWIFQEGVDVRSAGVCASNLAVLENECGFVDGASERFVFAVRALESAADLRYLAIALGNYGMFLLEHAPQADAAIAALAKASTLFSEMRDVPSEVLALCRLALAYAIQGDVKAGEVRLQRVAKLQLQNTLPNADVVGFLGQLVNVTASGRQEDLAALEASALASDALLHSDDVRGALRILRRTRA